MVEAEQWPVDAADDDPGIDGVVWQNGRLEIRTLEGVFVVTPGDWIITGIKGERYPCKNDIFQATYELVEEASKRCKRTAKRRRKKIIEKSRALPHSPQRDQSPTTKTETSSPHEASGATSTSSSTQE